MKKDESQYNNFVKDTQILGIRLTGSEFFKDLECDQHPFESLNKKLSFKVIIITTDDDYISPNICWELSFKKGRKILIKIKACYELIYKASEFFDDKVSNRFLSNAVKPATYPYFRQYANTISNDAYIPFPPLPILKLFPNNSTAMEIEEGQKDKKG